MATIVDTLKTVMEVDASNVDKQMQKAVAASKKATEEITAQHSTMAAKIKDALSKMGGEANGGEALGNVLKGFKKDALEEGTAALGRFGGALEALGPAGLAAAAGIAVSAAAFEAVSKVAEEITQIGIRSEKLGVGTTELQQLTAAAHVAGISTEQLDAGIGGLADTLGKLEAGIRIKRIQPWLDQLGLSQTDIDKTKGDVNAFFNLIADKLDGYSAAEKRAIASGLGIGSELLPLLDMEKSKREQINAEIAKYAPSPEVVAKTKEETEALEEQHEVLDAKLKADWAALIPLVDGIKSAWMSVVGAIADAAAGAVGFGNKLGDIKPSANFFQQGGNLLGGPMGGLLGAGLDKLTPTHGEQTSTERATQAAASQKASVARMNAEATLTSALQSEVGSLVDHHQHLNEINAKIAGFIKTLDASGESVPKLANGQYDESKLNAGQRADIARLRANANKEDSQGQATKGAHIDIADVQAIHSATIKMIEAQSKYSGSLDQLSALNVLKINQNAEDTQKDLRDKLKAGSITRPAYQQASADTETTRLQELKNNEIAMTEERIKRQTALDDQHTAMDVALLTAQAALATSSKQRADLEAQAFAKEQANTQAKFNAEIDIQVMDGKITAELGAQLKAEEAATLAAQAGAKAKELKAKADEDAQNMAAYSASLAERQANAEAALADTLKQRQAFEAKALQDKQDKERADLQKKIDANPNAYSPTAMSDLQHTQSEETAASNKKMQDQTPGGAYLNSMSDPSNEIASVGVKGLQGLNTMLADSILKTHSLKDAFHELGTSIIQELLQIAIQQAIIKPLAQSLFGGMPSGGGLGGLGGSSGGGGLGGMVGGLLSLLPHFAGGTDDAPGGPAVINEDGPELVNLPKGAQVMTHAATMAALGKQAPAPATQKGGDVHFHNTVYANDAMMEGTIKQWIGHGSMMAYQAARQASASDSARAGRQRLY